MSNTRKEFTSSETVKHSEQRDVPVLRRIYIPDTEERRRMERDRILYFES